MSSLTIQEQALVLETFVDAVESYTRLSALFYAELFRLDPQLRALFPPDLLEQERKLMRALAKLIHLIGDPKDFRQEVLQIVERHKAYNVKPIDYLTFGDAFVTTLGAVLGERFTPEAREAWNRVFQMFGQIVLEENYLITER